MPSSVPERRDGHQPIIHMQIGPIRFRVDPRSQSAQRPFEHRLVVRETGFELPEQASEPTIQELYGLLVTDENRNERIINDVLLAMEEGQSPILLTERKNHLEHLHQRLNGFVRHIVVLKGTLVQYAGRLHRLHPDKREVRIVDYVDSKVSMLAIMFEKRSVGYRAIGYQED